MLFKRFTKFCQLSSLMNNPLLKNSLSDTIRLKNSHLQIYSKSERFVSVFLSILIDESNLLENESSSLFLKSV